MPERRRGFLMIAILLSTGVALGATKEEDALRRAIAKEAWSRVLRIAEPLLADRPDDPELLRTVGDAAFHLHLTDRVDMGERAKRAYQKLLKRKSDIVARARLARLAAGAGDLETAKKHLRLSAEKGYPALAAVNRLSTFEPLRRDIPFLMTLLHAPRAFRYESRGTDPFTIRLPRKEPARDDNKEEKKKEEKKPVHPEAIEAAIDALEADLSDGDPRELLARWEALLKRLEKFDTSGLDERLRRVGLRLRRRLHTLRPLVEDRWFRHLYRRGRRHLDALKERARTGDWEAVEAGHRQLTRLLDELVRTLPAAREAVAELRQEGAKLLEQAGLQRRIRSLRLDVTGILREPGSRNDRVILNGRIVGPGEIVPDEHGHPVPGLTLLRVLPGRVRFRYETIRFERKLTGGSR